MLMLETQYRMHPEIAAFPSQEFYHGRLLNDPRMLPRGKSINSPTTTTSYLNSNSNFRNYGSHWKPYHNDRSGKFSPIIWHNFQNGKQELVGTSYCNQEEAKYILNLISQFYQYYPTHCSGGIGIIAAYKAQQKYLKKIFREKFGNILGRKSNQLYIEISTVDGFQGREMDIIIFSCVRTVSNFSTSSSASLSTSTSTSVISSGIGFMAEWQRLNVAITRAKYALWIVGDIKKLEDGGDVWRHLIQHCQRRGYFLFYLFNYLLILLLSFFIIVLYFQLINFNQDKLFTLLSSSFLPFSFFFSLNLYFNLQILKKVSFKDTPPVKMCTDTLPVKMCINS